MFSTGDRNTYDLVFNPAGDPNSTPDAPNVGDKRDDPFEEFIHAERGGDHGYPRVSGKVGSSMGTISPLATLPNYPSPTVL